MPPRARVHRFAAAARFKQKHVTNLYKHTVVTKEGELAI